MSYAKNENGNLALGFALAGLAIGVAVAGALDISMNLSRNVDLQAALDTALLSVAYDKDLDPSEMQAAVEARLLHNFHQPCTPVVVASRDTEIGSSTIVFQAHATCTAPTAMLSVAGKSTLTVTAATEVHARPRLAIPCVMTLDPSAAESLRLNSQARLSASECDVQVNSTASNALYVNSLSHVEADSVCVAGGDFVSSNSSVTPAAETSCAAKPDPFASVPAPSNKSDPCDASDLSFSTDTTLSPGVYCGKLEIQNGATLTLNPGTYVFRGGEVIANSGATIIGRDVTLFFDDEDAFLNANSGSVILLDAPDSGTYKGMVVMQDTDIHPGSSKPFIINSHSSSFLEGVVYTPASEFIVNSESEINDPAFYSIFVTRTLELNSRANLFVDDDYLERTPLPDFAFEYELALVH